MSDFETHPIGRVAQLKQRIFELEQHIIFGYVAHLKEELEKRAFIAGYEDGWLTGTSPTYFESRPDAEDAYKEWCKDG